MADETTQADSERIWEQLPSEPDRWFQCFSIYRRMGVRRTLLGAYNLARAEKGEKRQSRPSGAWTRAAEKWRWRERVKAYDDWKAERDDAERERRVRQLQDEEWKASRLLIEKAQQMLVFPLARTTREEQSDGGKTVIQTTVLPTKWSLRDAAAFFEMASKLGRLSTGQETENFAVDLRKAASEAGLDPDDPLFDELVKQILRKITSPPEGGASPGGGGLPDPGGAGGEAPGGGADTPAGDDAGQA